MGNKSAKSRAYGGLNREFLTMTILPLIVLGVFIVSLGCVMYSRGLHNEVQNGLRSVASCVLASYNEQYDGDFNLLVNDETGEMFLRKGDTIISQDTGFIDAICESTGIDVSLFFYDKRLMTTIMDSSGCRVSDTAAHQIVTGKVLGEKKEGFFEDVSIGGTSYFAEYIPVFGSDGTCVGMIGAAKPVSEVSALVNQTMVFNALVIVAAILLVTIIISLFTTNLVRVLKRMMRFLGEIADGNLSTSLDETIISRNDEIGEMGRFTVHVQSSLRKLIERDALTGIYNRRSGQNKILQTVDKSGVFAVAMADIDFFKKVNDTYGHDAGDEVLRTVSRILSDSMAGKGYACRWGGEEFLLVFERIDAQKARQVLWDILEQVRNTVVVSGEYEIKVTMSFGITEGVRDKSVDEQIKIADNSLYYAKTNGRNRVVASWELDSDKNDE